MFMMTGTIKCPMCRESFSSLEFWKQSKHDGGCFHLCRDCISKKKTTEDYLRIGYWHGYKATIEELKEHLSKMEDEY